MFINTFYSFKGGVGRTMALANIAANLASRERKVLAIDFDLEAPGLDTFPLLQTEEPVRGLVDYVRDYLANERAPDVEDFVAESKKVKNLYVMPSGSIDQRYAANFGELDWGMLYREQDGYLLFEDLKEQWRKFISPDYVFIDSRTGYSDTGGICTRQLPDAVTLLFFPNEQNLRGLFKVVSDIRSEKMSPRNKEIQLHFVMSNVPDLDDEDDILVEMNERFKEELAIDREPLVVHRYESLSLLNQSVFTIERPNSRLAREYKSVADEIVNGNLKDREGALNLILKQKRNLERLTYRGTNSGKKLERQIMEIRNLHSKDGEIQFQLGRLASEHELTDVDVEVCFEIAIEVGYKKPYSYLERAQYRDKSGDQLGAGKDALAALNFENFPAYLVMRAIRYVAKDDLKGVENRSAVLSLSVIDQCVVARMLTRIGKWDTSDAILWRLVQDKGVDTREFKLVKQLLTSNLIHSQQFEKAIELLTLDMSDDKSMGITEVFDYGMANWGAKRLLPLKHFERVLELHSKNPSNESDAHYLQCLAIANWAVGRKRIAKDFVSQAIQATEDTGFIFSSWRYEDVRRDAFLTDIRELQELLDGNPKRLPRVLCDVVDPV